MHHETKTTRRLDRLPHSVTARSKRIRHYFSGKLSACGKVMRPKRGVIEAVKDDDNFNCTNCARMKGKL